MKRRWPVWVTLLPLAIAVAGYYVVWRGFGTQFGRDIAAVLPGTTPAIGGFPYRLEADLASPRLVYDAAGLTARLQAGEALVNRGPWQPDLTVVRGRDVALALAVPPLAAATATLTAPTASASLHLADGRIARLSSVFQQPKIALGIPGVPIAATQLELHFRETPTPAAAAPTPRPPTQAQIVVTGEGVRLRGGDPLTLSAELALTAPAPIRSYAAWHAGGTAELTLTLADRSGEVLKLAATAVPGPAKALRLAGTVTTVCPNSVRAAFAGTPAPSEQRARLPLRLAFSGEAGALVLADPAPAAHSVRAQLPPCPVIRR